MRRVGIIGCGGIFPRHIESIEQNKGFELAALCDVQKHLVDSLALRHRVKGYLQYKEMIQKEDVDFVVIATPNSLHKDQALFALENGCDVLIEKPATFNTDDLNLILRHAKMHNQKAYCVLQVRLNPTVTLVSKVLDKGLLGNVRGFSFTQRWQRPLEYFSGWRGEPSVGGGILYETGIHYLDILQLLLGNPNDVVSTTTYKTKHQDCIIEDTVYSLLDYGTFGGTIESTIAAEPSNIESSISLLGSNGYIKLGGKALNIVESARFLSHGATVQYEQLLKDHTYSKDPNSYGSYQGSCPNHPDVYRNLEKFKLEETHNVINLIERIYKKAEIVYG
jgi:predicted dehydrogenase